MPEAYIVDAVRTAGGRRGGRLSAVHPVDLGAHVLDALIARSGLDPEAVEDVIMGCVSQAGEQTGNLARNVVLATRSLPQTTTAVTIDRQCGSSQQAIQFAAQAIMSGTQDVVIASGTESMTRVPMGSPGKFHKDEGMGFFMSASLQEKFSVPSWSQFMGAEMIAEKYGFSKDDLDAYALESHRRAAAAVEADAFAGEIVPITVETPEGEIEHTVDEGIRFDATPESIAAVKLLAEDGRLTAANSSQVCDGASAALIVSEEALKRYGMTPRARIVTMAVTGGDPVIMLEEPIRATQIALKKAGMSIGDIDLFECNEAFAPVPMAWMQQTGADHDRVNVHGGAIALGHPLGATGTKLMATLLHALHSRGKKYGLQTMCEGGGQANVTIIETL